MCLHHVLTLHFVQDVLRCGQGKRVISFDVETLGPDFRVALERSHRFASWRCGDHADLLSNGTISGADSKTHLGTSRCRRFLDVATEHVVACSCCRSFLIGGCSQFETWDLDREYLNFPKLGRRLCRSSFPYLYEIASAKLLGEPAPHGRCGRRASKVVVSVMAWFRRDTWRVSLLSRRYEGTWSVQMWCA